MYDPDSYENSTVEKCPQCGKFVSPENGFYDRENREDECSLVLAFCDEGCANSFHGGAPVWEASPYNIEHGIPGRVE